VTERLPHGSQHRKNVGVHVDVTPSASAPSPVRRQPWRQWHPRAAAKRTAETCSPRTGAPPANLRRPGPQGGEGVLEPLARLLHPPDSSHPPGHRSRGRATEPATPITGPGAEDSCCRPEPCSVCSAHRASLKQGQPLFKAAKSACIGSLQIWTQQRNDSSRHDHDA
jgi:hypothetical protein